MTLQPIVMKKGRPGNLLRVIAKPEDREPLVPPTNSDARRMQGPHLD